MIKLIYPEFWSKKGIVSFFLLPFSYIYIFLGYLRRLFTKPIRLPAYVICVGNATVGGTGKTQVVEYLAKEFSKQNINFLIVTKAYVSKLCGSKIVTKNDTALNVGDESILLANSGNVLASKNIKSALHIIEELKPDVIIFDDGMQNPSFIKDLNILVIDANRAIGNSRIFPAGPLREKIECAINKSDIMVMLGNNICEDIALINNIVASKKPFLKAKTKLVSELDLHEKYYAFTAIGNPNKFYDLLEKNKVNVVMRKSFPDHHNYTKLEIDELAREADRKKYSLITTKKDYVKISDDKITCAIVELDFENDKNLSNLIYEKLPKKN